MEQCNPPQNKHSKQKNFPTVQESDTPPTKTNVCTVLSKNKDNSTEKVANPHKQRDCARIHPPKGYARSVLDTLGQARGLNKQALRPEGSHLAVFEDFD